MKLFKHVVDFEKRSVIKCIVTKPSSYTEGPVIDTPWQVYCDGALGAFGAGVVATLISPSGIKLRYVAHL
jgi:ribonuclease HI